MRLSSENILNLAQTIALWQDRIISKYRTESGAVEPIFVLPVAQVRVISDSLAETILLTVVAPSGQQMTHSLPQPIAAHVAEEIPLVLAQMGMTRPTRQ